MRGCLGEWAGVLRTRGGIMLALSAIALVWLFVRSWKRARPRPSANNRLASEIRCERHGLRLRLEADTQSAFDDARFHVQCPLCAVQSSRDIS